MRKVTTLELYEAQSDFIHKHPILKIETTPLINDSYHKHFISEDGAEMWECNRVITEDVEVEVHGIKCHTKVTLWETECWNTDDSKSMYHYEYIFKN